MRNKIKITSLILAASLILPMFTVAHAEDAPSTKKRQEQVTADQKRLDRVSGLKRVALTQTQRTEKAVNKLSEMVTKIERVIAALNEKGVDTSSLQPSLDQAKVLKSEAETMIADLKAKHAAIDPGSSEVKRQVQAYQSSMNLIKKKLIEFHRALTGIVKQIRILEENQ